MKAKLWHKLIVPRRLVWEQDIIFEDCLFSENWQAPFLNSDGGLTLPYTLYDYELQFYPEPDEPDFWYWLTFYQLKEQQTKGQYECRDKAVENGASGSPGPVNA